MGVVCPGQSTIPRCSLPIRRIHQRLDRPQICGHCWGLFPHHGHDHLFHGAR